MEVKTFLTFLHRPLAYHSACLHTVSGCNMHGSCSIFPTKHMPPRHKYNLKVTHAMAAPPRYLCLLGNSGKFCPPPRSGATWLEQPQPVAIQLSLKDSSCAVLDRQAHAPQHTEEPLLGPPESRSSILHPGGEFQANRLKRKGGGGFLGVGRRCTLGHCVRPLTLEQETAVKPGAVFGLFV